VDKLADEIADYIIGFIRVVLASGVFWLLSAIYGEFPAEYYLVLLLLVFRGYKKGD
jgi:hypothetical protein